MPKEPTKYEPITNTQAKSMTKDGALAFFAEAMLGGSNNAIECMEAQGQSELVRAGGTRLPTELGMGHQTEQIRAALESWGVKLLGPVPGDALFQQAELPAGWSIKPTDHSMWSDLVDEKGRKRAAIFYKAAFYDRKAHLRLVDRFQISAVEGEERPGPVAMRVMDGEVELFRSKTYSIGDRKGLLGLSKFERQYECDDAAQKEAQDWLDKNKPDWRTPGAYWGDSP